MSKSRNEQRAERGNLRKWDKSHFPKYPFLPTLPYKFFAKPAATPSRIIESGGNPVKIPASTRREKRRAGGKYRYKWTRGNRLSSRTTIMTVTRRYTPITQRGGKNGLALNPPSFTPQWFSSTAISIVCFVNWTFESDSNAIIFEFAFPSFFFLIIFKREDKRRGTIFYD